MKSAVIVSAAIIAATLVAMMGLYLYFSPYHSCVRALLAAEYEPADAALTCLHGPEPSDEQPSVGGWHAGQSPLRPMVNDGKRPSLI
jgi:hypothetical protein